MGGVGSLLVLCGTATAQPQGYWKETVSVNYSGSSEFKTGNEDLLQKNWTVTGTNGGNAAAPHGGTISGAGYSKVKYENIEVVCIWVSGNHALPPSSVSLKVSASANAEAYHSRNTTPDIQVELNNGFGGETNSITLNIPDDKIYHTWQKSSGDRIISGSTSGGHWIDFYNYEVSVPIEITITARQDVTVPNTGQYGRDPTVNSNVTAGFSAAPDNRFVWISSGIDTSFKKENGQRVPCMPDASGAMTVHSVAQWSNPIPSNDVNDPQWKAGETFTANTQGFNTSLAHPTYPRYEWSFSGGTLTDAGQQEVQSGLSSISLSARIGLGGNDRGTSMQKTSTLKVKVTDYDGAVGENSYKVNWHLPSEGKKALPLPQGQSPYTNQFLTKGELTTPVRGESSLGNQAVTFSWDPALIQFVEDYLHNLAGLGEAALNWAGNTGTKMALIAFNIWGGTADLEQENYTFDRSTAAIFSKSQQLDSQVDVDGTPTVPNNLKPLVPPGFDFDSCRLVEPMYWTRYGHEFYEHDAYGTHGFEGVETTKADKINDEHPIGRYKPVGQVTP
ncbi:MAG TPA: hypothetical protein VF600_11010 [Abditibacteriaceae bacterium]